MNDKELEELLDARFEELKSAIQDLNLIDFDNLDCRDAVRSICGVKLDERNFNLMSLAMMLNERRGEGSMTLDEAVTHLNNLPLGLKIADMQRGEVYSEEPELQLSLEGDSAKSLEQLCDEYEQALADENYPQNVVDYVCALEDLVSEMQGKSFADSSRIGQLEAENAALKTRD
ncbi:hypothetical protein ACRN98_22095 [Shewanella oncorhynchi]|uniref:hypothetical protein n=1 Tax=Shewanella TaxID=22 RepID=UPI0021D9C262|nr:hypothetical protein [Shewanella sp. SM69]MCU8036956.1 hypothetical protein [Shewanella sp. SM69]